MKPQAEGLGPFASKWRRFYARAVFLPTLGWNMFLGRVLKLRRWWDYIDPHVMVGAYPFARDVEGLYAEGVRAVVNTCEEYAGPIFEYQRLAIDQLCIPTTDFTHPRLEDVSRAVDFVEMHVEQGNKVYIHCKAGRARSATVALCWLIKYRNLTADEAQMHLQRSRAHVNPHISQRPVVQAFVAALQRAAKEKAAPQTSETTAR